MTYIDPKQIVSMLDDAINNSPTTRDPTQLNYKIGGDRSLMRMAKQVIETLLEDAS